MPCESWESQDLKDDETYFRLILISFWKYLVPFDFSMLSEMREYHCPNSPNILQFELNEHSSSDNLEISFCAVHDANANLNVAFSSR